MEEIKDYQGINDIILEEWEKARPNYNFSYDGLMYNNEDVNKAWHEACPRILFITKDQNAAGGIAWDSREEEANLAYAFYRNLVYILWGLHHTTPTNIPDYKFTNQEAVDLYNKLQHARINVKKDAGGNSVSNAVLKGILEDKTESEFIIKQINNLDADILICCGYSDYLEDTGNLILNFLNNNGYCFKEVPGCDYWLYYDSNCKKIAINTYHLSARISHETTYQGITEAYHKFLTDNPEFLKKR